MAFAGIVSVSEAARGEDAAAAGLAPALLRGAASACDKRCGGGAEVQPKRLCLHPQLAGKRPPRVGEFNLGVVRGRGFPAAAPLQHCERSADEQQSAEAARGGGQRGHGGGGRAVGWGLARAWARRGSWAGGRPRGKKGANAAVQGGGDDDHSSEADDHGVKRRDVEGRLENNVASGAVDSDEGSIGIGEEGAGRVRNEKGTRGPAGDVFQPETLAGEDIECLQDWA